MIIDYTSKAVKNTWTIKNIFFKIISKICVT